MHHQIRASELSTQARMEPYLHRQIGRLSRRDEIVELLPIGAVGIELGVAEGWNAQRMLGRPNLSFLYGVDMFAGDRGHDIDEYRRAITRLTPFRTRFTLLRMRFDEALSLFDEESLDFIYVDGYAHTGEEQGQTFHDWWPKLKRGGIFAGDDYDPAWPLVVHHVDRFVRLHSLELHTVPGGGGDWASNYPSWLAFKP